MAEIQIPHDTDSGPLTCDKLVKLLGIDGICDPAEMTIRREGKRIVSVEIPDDVEKDLTQQQRDDLIAACKADSEKALQ